MDKNEQQYRDILNRSCVLMLDWRVQSGVGRVEFISENVERVLGYPSPEILSEAFSWLTIVHPEDLPRLEAAIQAKVERGQTAWLQDYRLRTRSGSFRWFQEQGSIQVEPNGDAHIQSTAFDISDYRQALEALGESETKFKKLAEQSPNMIFINQRGRIVYVNEQCTRTMGYQKEEFYAEDFNFLVLVAPEHHELIHQNMQKHARGEDVPPLEYAIVTKAGVTIDVILSTRLIQYEGDMAILGIVTDITERKRTEKRVVQYQQRLRSLASELARTEERQRHELATQLHDGTCQELALLKMQLQSLMTTMPEQHQEACTAICQGLTESMERLRDLSFDLSPPVLYASGLYAALEKLVENQLKEYADVTWTLESSVKRDDLPDDVRILLYRSVRELLINVVKHARADMVSIQCTQLSGAYHITVTDNGIGFDFTQVEPAQSGGFGLFNIQERLRHFGGELTIRSRPQRGSCIRLTLPLLPSAETPVGE